MRKLKSLIIIIAVFCVSWSAYAYSDVETWTEYCEPVQRLGALNIMNGYEDGTFRPDERITRAEFAKVIVCALNKEQDAMSEGYVSPFDDVRAGEWYVPYVNYVANNGIVTGYADGTYKPDNDITYAEVSTIILRMMGYNETDLGYYWPLNYTTKANSLLLAGNAVNDSNVAVSRSTAAIMLYNALFSDVNASAAERSNTLDINYQKDISLLEAIGYTIKEDVFIVATNNEDPNLAGNKVRTSEATYKIDFNKVSASAGKIGDAVINKDGDEIVLFLEKESRNMTVIVSKVTGNRLEYTLSSGKSGIVTLDKGFVIYDDYAKSTFEALQSKLVQGTSLTLYSDNSDGWSYAVLNSTTADIIPVIASHDYTAEDTSLEGMYITEDNLTVYRDSKSASLSDIRTNDVVYYNTGANIMNVYSKKVTGIYYEAKPSKAYVESVIIGNVEYSIGTTAAKSKLDATSSAFEIGDRVTLLLGENDEIAYVLAADAVTGSSEYGVVINTSVKTENTGEAKYIAKIFTAEEKTTEIVTYDNYSALKGDMVQIKYENGVAKLTKLSTGSGYTYGAVDKSGKKIGAYSVGANTVIMELVSNNSGADAVVKVIDFATLEEPKLDSDKVKCMISDTKFGDIRILFVEGWTDASYNYGLVTYSKEAETNSNSETPGRSITIYSDGVNSSYRTGLDVTTGTPVKFIVEDGSVTELNKLMLIKSASSVNASEMGRIKVGGTVYETARNVLIVAFDSSSRNCRTLSAEQLENIAMKSIKLYSDSKAGKIKAIVVEE